MITIRLSFFGDSTILIDGAPITSTATHLFALILLLAQSQERRLTRLDLQQFLFDSIPPRQASHNLRQLLYRLRGMGLVLNERPTGLRLVAANIVSASELFRGLSQQELEALRAADLSYLSSYSPNLPRRYLEWLNGIRDSEESQLRRTLRHHLEMLRDSHSWATALHVGRMLLEGDPFNEDIIAVVAESLAILGRRQEALSLLDDYDRELTGEPRLSPLHSLRARVNRLPDSKRAPVLYGRESSLLFLQRQWDAPDSHGGRQLALIGHSGVGKTRLANAFAAKLALGGANVVRYECDVNSRDQPFSLFSHILPDLQKMRGSLGASPAHTSSLSRIRQFEVFGERSSQADASVKTFRLEAQAALIDLLEAISIESRVLLVVDDAHFLDDASRSVVRELTGTSNDADVMLVLCLRRSPNAHPLLAHKRCVVLPLEPLSESASRALLSDVMAEQGTSEEHLTWCLEHAAGNPFFLHALATHPSSSTTPTPFDVRSLASRAYSALSSEARSVLESCLLLGRFATLQRVQSVTHIAEESILAALRSLEEQDLIHSVNGVLSGPHALLHDALSGLIPSSVSALLHSRIALNLQAECIQEGHAPSFALMAARSWLAAGDPLAATKLLRQCASYSSSLGEPGMAVTLLSEVLELALPNTLRATIIDDLVEYAQAVGLHAMAAVSLRERYQIARISEASATELAELELRIVEGDLLNGGQLTPAISPLLRLLEETTASISVRLRAAVRLMILADQDLNVELAMKVHHSVQCLTEAGHKAESLLMQEKLIFHTSFGNVTAARSLAENLADMYPSPSLDPFATRARSFAAYAFYRLRECDKAKQMCEDTYDFMSRHRAASHALYSSSLLAEMAVTEGRFTAASAWIEKASTAAGATAPHQISPSSGLYYAASVLAMVEGRYHEAEQFQLSPGRHFPILAASRNRAVCTALGVRIRQLRGDTEGTSEELQSLEALYEQGKRLGGQDSIVETLWCARIMFGDVTGASTLLYDYLTCFRRERSEPDWSLRYVTGADESWQRVIGTEARSATHVDKARRSFDLNRRRAYKEETG